MSKGSQKQERRALSIAETAEVLDLSVMSVRRAIDAGRLSSVKVGRRRLVPVAAIDAMLSGKAA